MRKAICNICRKETLEPWIIEGWRPVCKACFDSFRSEVEQVQAQPKRGGTATEPKTITAEAPGYEPILIILPEDASLLHGQPQAWRDLWDRSEVKKGLDAEKKWPADWAELPEQEPEKSDE